jgi:acyl carrier protein
VETVSPGLSPSTKPPSAQQAGTAPSLRQFLQERISRWEPELELDLLGLDSLDLVDLRTSFNSCFGMQAPLSLFTADGQTLAVLENRLEEMLHRNQVINRQEKGEYVEL